MNPRFSNFTVAIVALAVVSIAEKITSLIKVGMAGYPPLPPKADVVVRSDETLGTDVEEKHESA